VSRTALRVWMAGALALVLAAVDYSIAAKERIRAEGEVVYLQLAPVDPRSLMQGDYLALRFLLADAIEQGLRREPRAAEPAAVREGAARQGPLQPDEFLVLMVARDIADLRDAAKRAGDFRTLAAEEKVLIEGARERLQTLVSTEELARRVEVAIAKQEVIAREAGRARSPVPPSGARALEEGRVGRGPIALDGRRVASLAAGDSALRIRYRVRNGRVWLGTNAFFFSEGEARRFAPARFGEFRLDGETGEALLVGLCDADLRPL